MRKERKKEKHNFSLLWFVYSPYLDRKGSFETDFFLKENSINMLELARVVVDCPISGAKSFSLLLHVSLSSHPVSRVEIRILMIKILS